MSADEQRRREVARMRQEAHGYELLLADAWVKLGIRYGEACGMDFEMLLQQLALHME